MSEPGPDDALYAVEYRRPDGAWRLLHAFRRPLDADRAYEALLDAGAQLPVRLARYRLARVVVAFDPEEG